MLSAHNAGWAPDLIWVGCAFFYGGIAQFLAGMWEFKNGNTFGSYGAFWMSLAFFVMLDLTGKIPTTDVLNDLGWFVLAFAIFKTYMLIWSSRTNMAVFLVFLVLEITEIILFIGYFAASTMILKVGGYVGVLDALIAWYASAATVGNSMSKRIIAPVGGPLWKDPPELAHAA